MYIMALNTLVKVYTWDELFLTLRNLANLINKRTMLIIHRLKESEKMNKECNSLNKLYPIH